MANFLYKLPSIDFVSESDEVIRLLTLLSNNGLLYDFVQFVNEIGLDGYKVNSMAITNDPLTFSRNIMLSCRNPSLEE